MYPGINAFGGETYKIKITVADAPNLYILPDCWKKGTDWMFTVNNGKIEWTACCT